MIELLESAAGLHRIAILLEQDGKPIHAGVLKTTIKLELESALGRVEDEEVKSIRPGMLEE